MNKRIVLNVMIIAMLTFFMIFNIVYQRLINKHDTAEIVEIDIWDKPFLVPKPWQITRLEMPSVIINLDESGQWTPNNQSMDQTRIATIISSWQELEASSVSHYENLPNEGELILAFIAQDTQPLVFRMLDSGSEIIFYRMIDAKQFNFQRATKPSFLGQ
jgi:hypothetical protein